MKTITALIQREYLEHKGAFLYAPAVILGLLTLVLLTATGIDRPRLPTGIAVNSGKVVEVAFLAVAALWFVYLLAALFFYFADAFNADRRNNAMLFWKSMPVSDFTVLGAKLLAGLTIFPALILAAVLLNAMLLVVFALFTAWQVPGMVPPDLLTVIGAGGQVGLFAIVSMLLALLWYAPFFAWVGMLSTLVGRWSIPLAFLIPGMIGLFEKLTIGAGDFDRGHFLAWLGERLHFGLDRELFAAEFLTPTRFEAVPAVARLLTVIDWTQFFGGLAVAMLLVYAASEYRRRFIAA